MGDPTELEEFTSAIEAVAAENAPEPEADADEPTSPADEKVDAKDTGDDDPGAEEAAKKDSNGTEEEESPEEESDLVKRAAEYGISKDELAEFGDSAEAMVNRVALIADREISKIGKATEPEPKAKDDVVGEKTPGVPDEPGSVVKGLLENGYEADEPIIKAIKQLEAQNAELRQKLSEPAQADHEAATAKVKEEVESFFTSVPKEYQDLVGKGETTSLKEGSKEFAFRQEVLEEALALDIGYQKQGKVLPIKDLFQKAFNMLTHDKVKEIARKEMTGKLKKRQSGASTPPSGKRSASEPVTQDAAIKEMADLMKEHNLGA
jgi:hypothetical protein